MLIVSALAMAWMLLRPAAGHDGLNLVPLREIARVLKPLMKADEPLQHPSFRYLLWNAGGNIAAFFPLGLAVAGLFHPRGPGLALRRAVLTGFFVSLAIETVQLVVPGRITDVDDLLFNTLGALLGGLLGLWILRRRRSR